MPERGDENMKISPFRRLVSLSDALRIVMENTLAVGRMEDVALASLAGRVLARDVVSPMDVPPFDRAAMDGYAVRSEDVAAQASSTPWR